jgi:DNA-damage-inducible protein J
MAKSEIIRARVEPALKHEAEAVLGKLGMTPTEAITLFYKQVTLYRSDV